jgi:DNA polymerase-3 subunit gamma/tau
VLGVADHELILEVADSVAAQDPRAALLAADRLAASGRDATQFMRDFSEHLRRLYVTQTLGEVPDQFATVPEHADRISAQAERLSQADVLRTIDLLGEAISAVKDGSDPRIRLELALLKATQPPTDLSLQALMFRIEQLERRITSSGAAPAGPPEAAPVPERQPPPPETGPAPAADPQGPTAARETPEPAAAPTPEAAAVDEGAVATIEAGPPAESPETADDEELSFERLQAVWPAVVDAVRKENAMVGALFGEARAAALEAGRLVVDFPADREFLKKKAEASGELLARALRGLTGQAPAVEYRLNGEAAGPVTLSEEELLTRLKEEFGATEVGVPDPQTQDRDG